MSVDNDNSSSNDYNATISNEPEVGDIGYIDNAPLSNNTLIRYDN
jgi:hypothetical protein